MEDLDEIILAGDVAGIGYEAEAPFVDTIGLGLAGGPDAGAAVGDHTEMEGAGIDVGHFGEEVVECAAMGDEGVESDELTLGAGVGIARWGDVSGVVDCGGELVGVLA